MSHDPMGQGTCPRVPLYGYCISQQIFEDLVFYCAGVCLADLLPQRQDGSRGNGQLVDPDGKEGLGQIQIGAKLTADPDPHTVLVRIIADHL